MATRPTAHGAIFLWLGMIALAVLSACNHAGDGSPREKNPAKDDSRQRKPFDAVAVNGPVFEGWPKPRVALVLTGLQQGYLEPCGCAGLENQKGGLSRRFALLNQLRSDRGWPLVTLDLGDLVRRYGREAEIKLHSTIDALAQMQYDAATFGPGDLRLPADNLLLAATDLSESSGTSRIVSANVGLFGHDSGILPPWRIVQREGLKFAVTAVLGETRAAGVKNEDIQVAAAAESLKQIVPQIEAAECDFNILLAQASLAQSRTLGQQFPLFDVVVSAGGADEPPRQPKTINGQDTMLVELGHKGMYAAVIGIYEDEPRLRFQRVPLDARYQGGPEMRQLMASFQEELKSLGFAGLGLRGVVHPRGVDNPELGRFIGSAACGDCHAKAYAKWKTAGHGHATETLVKLTPPRQFDPECVSCHVTGWNPREYFPYQSGFQSIEQTPKLVGNGCENCHGPGAAHVRAEKVRRAERDPALQEQLRLQMRLTKATAEEQSCRGCHDLDNSPEFNFPAYWAKIEHPWKD